MNKEQAITSKDEAKRELEKLKECAFLMPKTHQALDIAIESLDENERLKKERDYILEKAKAELKDNKWVDVRDRLPSESGYYVVTREYNRFRVIENEVRQFYFNGEKWLTDFEGFDITPEVVAWKKVEPYERDKKKV